MTKTIHTEKAARDLIKGDEVISASGKTLKVSEVILKENRTIVLFDGDMEIDFNPYFTLKIKTNEQK
jgi:preprotein translocase subunit YajC